MIMPYLHTDVSPTKISFMKLCSGVIILLCKLSIVQCGVALGNYCVLICFFLKSCFYE